MTRTTVVHPFALGFRNPGLVVAAALVTACSTAPAAGGEPPVAPVPVDGLRIIVMPTDPVRVQVVVTGRRLEGAPIDIVQGRDGRRIVVTMTQPARDRALVPFTERVVLHGAFEPGAYAVTVNERSTTFEIR